MRSIVLQVLAFFLTTFFLTTLIVFVNSIPQIFDGSDIETSLSDPNVDFQSSDFQPANSELVDVGPQSADCLNKYRRSDDIIQ